MGGQVALAVLGMFVLVWIISAVVKATQVEPPKRNPNDRRNQGNQRVERTSSSDIDRFLAEIDRLRTKGEGSGGPPPLPPNEQQRREQSRTSQQQRSSSSSSTRTSERKPNQQQRRRANRPVPPPPPLPPADVPVLRPVEPAFDPSTPVPPPIPVSSTSPGPSPSVAKEAKVAKVAKTAKLAKLATSAPEAPTPVLQAIQGILKSKEGIAAALILSEVLGEPRSSNRWKPPV